MRLLPVAAAVALLLPLTDVYALALGRASVQSGLGEPLRAEVEVTQITPEEAASLRAAPAAFEAFRAAGIERHPALNELRVTPERLANGRFVIRLSSDRVINEPVIDLLLEATWGAGRIVRDYTLLFDPPANRAEAPGAVPVPPSPVVAAQLPPLPPLPPSSGLAPGETAVPSGPQAGVAPVTSPAPAAPGAPAAAPASAPSPVAVPAPTTAPPAAARVTVRAGDTAGKLAAAAKPASVSLEQMLVALLRANPDAFVANNMNRLKAGAVLEMPAAEAAATVEAREARRTVIAQSQDFNEFRRRLAEATPAGPEGAAGAAGPAASRRAAGQVDARVEEKNRRPADTAPDRLTLSKGAVQGQAAASAAAGASAAAKGAKAAASAPPPAAEDRIARQRAEQEAGQRQTELERNIAELNRLNAGVAGALPSGSDSAAASAASGVALNLPTSAASAASAAAASDAAATASAPSEAASAAPAAGASAAQASASTARAAASGAANVRPGLADRLMAALANLGTNPWPLAIGSAVLAGLAAVAGLLWWNRRKPKAPALAGAPGSPASKASRDDKGGKSMAGAGASGWAQSTTSSGESQIAAEGDPLAEADVYLSYGRDLQAEEILEEALRATPNRLPIITKLLEVYARRFDWDAFEPLARRARTLTGAQGPDWARIVALGASLAPVGHPLFSADASDEDAEATDLQAAFGAATPASGPQAFVPQAGPSRAELGTAPAVPAGLELDIEGFRMPAPAPDAPAPGAAAQDPDLDSLFEDDLGPPPDAYRAGPTPPGAAMEFDLAGLSLDLNPPAAGASAGAGAGANADALATKLSLAEEFLSIGDTEGARSLAEEVRAQASGDLRARAERLLSELG